MFLDSYLDPKLIYVEEQAKSRDQIYRILVEMICKHHKLPTCGSKLVDMILAREQESSTAYPNGLAIPHIRMEGLYDTVIGICMLKHPLVEEGVPISTVVLIITDVTSAKLYLNIVSAIIRLSKDHEATNLLKAQPDGSSIYKVLQQMKVVLQEELTIKDIMTPHPFTVKPETTLREMSDLMNEHQTSYIPVVDGEGNFVGEVNVLRYLKVGIPDYLMLMANLNFLRTYEPFESLYKNEATMLVRQIMDTKPGTLKPGTSIIEAAFEMIQNDRRFYPVVENKKLVGIVTAMDIFRKVVRI